MSQNQQFISLNFLPLVIQDFAFKVFRKSYNEEKKEGLFEDCHRHRLPIDNKEGMRDDGNWSDYWISFNPLPGFEEFICREGTNHLVTENYLFSALHAATLKKLKPAQYIESRSFFRQYISFILTSHSEGKETVWLQPYYLNIARTHGFLIDFEFRMDEGVTYSRRVQQLSLSLDRSLRENINFYSDRYQKIQLFLNQFYPRLFPLSEDPDLTLDVEKTLLKLPAEQLNVKHYVFSNDKESNSQYKGIKEFLPLKPIDKGVTFYFMFRKRDNSFANQLYSALKGDTFPTTFQGMEEVFKLHLDRETVRGKALEALTKESFITVIDEIKLMTTRDRTVIPILILPSKDDEESKKTYYLAKYLFIRESIPIQVVTLDVIKNLDTLKWSISNIGLQIFAKLGGQPWKVKPSNKECLIIGVGQAHKEVRTGDHFLIEKYFAYSVLTDSSGLYIDLEVLGSSNDKAEYLDDLKKSLRNLITKHQTRFRKFVIHAPFKIQMFELNAIRELLESLVTQNENGDFEFVVLKVNSENKFFGYDLSANSMIPFESTYLKLSPKEYLLWFEGIQYQNPNVYKRFSGPTHVEFYFATSGVKGVEKSYLQDVLNLSGANWRGFNAKSLPVSILYCQLVAKFIKEFDTLGYTNYQIDNLKPWFL